MVNVNLQEDISKKVDSTISKKQKEYFLMEQLKNIKKELGLDSDGKEKLIEKFNERILKLKMTENVKKVYEEVDLFLIKGN